MRMAAGGPQVRLHACVLIALCFCVESSWGDFYGQNSDVVVLTTKNYEILSESHGVAWFVEFYADWCHACNALRPVWLAAAQALSQSSLNRTCKVAAVSCEDQPTVCRKERIPAYPEMRYYPSTPEAKPISYHGHISPRDIVVWIESMVGPVPGLPQKVTRLFTDADSGRKHTPPDTRSLFPRRISIQDMASSITHAFDREIFKVSDKLSGDKLQVLVNFIDLLASRFPFPHNRQAFIKLNFSLESIDVLTISKWEGLMSEFQIGDLPKKSTWPYCHGDLSRKRHQASASYWKNQDDHLAYPCGLWLLFHSIAVRTPSYLDEELRTKQGIRAWITTFFGCRECSDHFQELTMKPSQTYIVDDVNGKPTTPLFSSQITNLAQKFITAFTAAITQNSSKKAIATKEGDSQLSLSYKLPPDLPIPAFLWLWMAHNMVNHRLGVSLFPSIDECPSCRLEKPASNLNASSLPAVAPLRAKSRHALSPGEVRSLTPLSFLGVVWSHENIESFLADRYCMSGPPDELADKKKLSEECLLAAQRWTPTFRKRHNIEGKQATYIMTAFVVSLAFVSLAACIFGSCGGGLRGRGQPSLNDAQGNRDCNYSAMEDINIGGGHSKQL